ncbi:homeodomain-only protein [Latimeria chalumnae]|uniref:Homeodomain-only protein n=1 Tax=Latimeria chalumnae TaxID=7897 RepID=H3A2H1_LATCH|nr:PREDICTED: homeodomain-only protein [Latimeria chalumnae]|eukprot:XP_006011632.1 PREDICTED: homeodomain-only protein [Latimeria chalumnae]
MASGSSNGGLAKDSLLTAEQLQLLEENFKRVSKQPEQATLILIAAECGLSEEETVKWFKQRYSKWRESEGLPPESGSVKD